MFWFFIPPAIGLVAAVGAGLYKKNKAQATGTAAGQAAGASSATTGAAGSIPGVPAGTTGAATTMTLAEAYNNVLTATTTGNPKIMRDMATKLRAAGYPDQATQLEAVASSIEVVQAQVAAGQQPAAQIVDGSTWQYTHWNASTGYSYLVDPSGTEFPVPASNIRANGTNQGVSQDFTLADGRIIRNPVKPSTFHQDGGIQPQGQPPQGQPPTPAQPAMSLNDANTLLATSIASGNPQIMRDAAAKLRANGYPTQAATLETAATVAQNMQPPQVQPPPAQPPPAQPPQGQPPTPAQPAMSLNDANALLATSMASGNPQIMRDAATKLRANGYTIQAQTLETAANVAQNLPKPPLVVPPVIPPVIPPMIPPVIPPLVLPVVPPVGANKAAADNVVNVVLHQAKGSAAQVAAVSQFQTAENLPRKDGQYGSETAIALADRYNIVPPQPLYWGPKGGTYAQYLADKKAYQAFLNAKATKNPPGTQWTVAAQAIKLSGDEIGDEFASDPSPGRDKALASSLYLALRYARKGTPSEPRPLLQKFQEQEGLQIVDGSYNSETAAAMADRYNLVPAKPFYWGRKGGSPDVARKDRAQYQAHMMVLADRDPQRSDEWRNAAKV